MEYRNFTLVRTLVLEAGGTAQEACLICGPIVCVGERKWACHAEFSPIQDEVNIYGDDPLAALMNCLSFISQLIVATEDTGVEIYWQSKGDRGGFSL